MRYNPKLSINARILQFFKIYKINTVLDIGANIGQYALWLRESGYKGRIISFEPLSEAYQHLLINSKKDPNWIIAPRMALDNEEGEKFINIASNYVSSSILKMSDILIKAATETVYMCTEKIYITQLDNIVGKYLKINNNIFLKIDVQGYALQVLEGASKILPKIKGMQIELSLVHLYEGQSLYHNMLDYIINLGFELYDILPVFSDKKKWKASAI
jgi:FkbM family methyltransferase